MTIIQTVNLQRLIETADLPMAARRWLTRSLPENLNLPTSIELEQEGEMEIRGRWTPFKARGVYTAAPLSFTWQARFQMLPGVWILAEDGHREGKGWGGAQLWGIISMGKKTDPEVLASQLVRNLGELAWLPALALTDPGLEWTEAGETAIEVRTRSGGQEATVRFQTDDQGDILRAYSPARPYDISDGYAEAPWHYEFSDHREFEGIRIPSKGIARFEKSEGTWEYFRGRITAVQS